MKKRKTTIIDKKYLFIFFGVLIIGFLVFYFLNSNLKNVKEIRRNEQILKSSLKTQEEQYQKDIYGGKTPEETYQMFLEALKKEDIDLATKYFLFEKQEEYKKLLESIKRNGQWEEMLKDLLKPENQKGVYLTEDWYKISVINDKNEVVTVISIQRPKGAQFENLGSLWKIVEF
ncbi:MAG: hypothetical protein ACPLXL_01350 [Minisyncoccia bacterium]